MSSVGRKAHRSEYINLASSAVSMAASVSEEKKMMESGEEMDENRSGNGTEA